MTRKWAGTTSVKFHRGPQQPILQYLQKDMRAKYNMAQIFPETFENYYAREWDRGGQRRTSPAPLRVQQSNTNFAKAIEHLHT